MKGKKRVTTILILLLVFSVSETTFGYSSGVTGSSTNGCGCHGSSDNIRDEEEQNKVTESSFIADLRPWGCEKYASSAYQDLTRSPS